MTVRYNSYSLNKELLCHKVSPLRVEMVAANKTATKRKSKKVFMLNIIAMVAVIAAILLSKHKLVPAVILTYYAAYMLLESSVFGAINDYGSVSVVEFNVATIYYSLFTAIELIVISALCLNKGKFRKVGFIYAFIVFTSMFFNAAQAVSMTLHTNWLLDFYTIRQQFAIPLDIIFAWMGGDNFVSRKLTHSRSRGSDVHYAASRGKLNQINQGVS